MKFKDFFLIC